MECFNCETCNYKTSIKAHYAIHCKTKRHCTLVGTTYEVKEKVTKVDTNVQDTSKELVIQNMKLLHELELLKQQLKHQEEMGNMKEQMNKVKEDMTQRLLSEKDKMIDYLMNKASQVVQVVPQVTQVAPQVAPQVVNDVVNEVIKVSKKELKEEIEDDTILSKKYIIKHCQMDSIGFSKSIEVIDDDYELFMTGEFIPMRKVITQVLERNLKRITLHEMGCIVLNDKIYTHLDEWMESSKGLHHLRQQIAKEMRQFLMEDPIYFEKMQYLGEERDDLPTEAQLEQYTGCTQALLQLEMQERSDFDKDIKAIIEKYSTK